MTTNEQVRGALDKILVPGIMRSLVGLNLVRNVSISNGVVNIDIADTALNEAVKDWVKARTAEAVKSLPDVKKVETAFSANTPAELNNIRHIFAVMSGKGGVGKSLVASLAAVALKRKGYEVGILDADITGPSIPRMFGINTRPTGSESGILPVPSKSGIPLMSINLLLPSEEEAVIWRGPLIGKTINQFGNEVLWGNLDYLIIDLPPGTADAPLTVLQSFPVSGIIIVFTPQNLVEMIVKKAVRLAQKMDKRIIGLVENMVYLQVPDTNQRIEVFGKSRGKDMARFTGAPLLGQLPMDPNLARLSDEGNIEKYDGEIVGELGKSLSSIK